MLSRRACQFNPGHKIPMKNGKNIAKQFTKPFQRGALFFKIRTKERDPLGKLIE